MVHRSLSLNINGIKRKLSKLAYNLSILAEDFSIIPKNDPRQALRIRRFFISLGIYALNLPLCYLAYQAGLMESQGVFLVLDDHFSVQYYFIYHLSHRSQRADEGSQPDFHSNLHSQPCRNVWNIFYL